MKLCYCDETGTGEEPFAVLLGVVVDATRMHVTKDDWAFLLNELSKKLDNSFMSCIPEISILALVFGKAYLANNVQMPSI